MSLFTISPYSGNCLSNLIASALNNLLLFICKAIANSGWEKTLPQEKRKSLISNIPLVVILILE